MSRFCWFLPVRSILHPNLFESPAPLSLSLFSIKSHTSLNLSSLHKALSSSTDRTMAARSRELSKQWKERETSPERTKIWTEPKPTRPNRKVPVVYYLTRSGQLEHPHFIEVPLSSNDGLYLQDVINRLNLLRGKGMASMYSWSSKRSYKNGFVWHDLSDDDFIYPAHGNEYVLKGSEIIQPTFAPSEDTTEPPLMELPRSAVARDEASVSASSRSFDLNEYKVYKNDLTAEAAGKAVHASTQTDDRRRHRRALDRAENPTGEEDNPTTELGRDEISPPPSSSSPETLESLIRSDGRVVEIRADDQDRTAGSGGGGGRHRASAVLMHLISCGSISVKDHELSLVTQYKRRLPRGSSGIGTREMDGPMETPSFPAVRMEDKEYFSGSLIETKKRGSDFASLKRSSSYNADRGSKLELAAEKEIEGLRGRCIPRRPKPSQRESQISRSAHGSKRINDEPPHYTEN